MQIYSSSALGLDLTHSAGSREGEVVGEGVAYQRGPDQVAAHRKLIL